MNSKTMAQRIARRVLADSYTEAYKASGDLEKVMGEILTKSLGITDAPEEFFDAAKEKLEANLAKNDLEMDLDDPDVYPYIRRAVNEVADSMEMIK